MKGDPEFLILNHSAWIQPELEDNILGSIVKNPLSPTSNYVPREPAKAMQYNKNKLQEDTGSDFVLTKSSAKSHRVEARVGKIADAKFKGTAEDILHLSGKVVHVKRLTQIDQFWADLRLDETVVSTVPEWLSGWSWARPYPVCMIVGIMICEDAEHQVETTSTSKQEVTIEVPAGTITGAAYGAPPIVSGMIDPSSTLEHSDEASSNFQAKYRNGNIFAVELQKVTAGFFHEKELKLKPYCPKYMRPNLRACSVQPRKNKNDDDDDDWNFSVGPEDLMRIGLEPMELDHLVQCTPLLKYLK
ncbi:hypothetical protein K4K59_009110 [Colletotrichum sp. SAR11_240]|nr:hypothetical protein K4K59_009110 [Colletotrichum sp. SAR11_240]